MKIHWLIPGNYRNISELRSSNLASIRMRVAVSIDAILAAGWDSVTCGDNIPDNTGTILIGKIGGDCNNGRAKHWSAQINEFKKREAKIIIDFTDNHLGYETNMTNFYKTAVVSADALTASSKHLASILYNHSSAPVTVIDEPIEFLPLKVRPTLQQLPSLLWFGHASNSKYFLDFLQMHRALLSKAKIIALSNPEGLELIRRSDLKNQLNLHLVNWSVEEMIKSAQLVDICIIPSDLNDPRKAGASANRLITSLALGLPTAANLVDSYCQFTEYFVDIQSPTFPEMLDNPRAFLAKTQKAQDELIPLFTVEAIRRQWTTFLNTSDV